MNTIPSGVVFGLVFAVSGVVGIYHSLRFKRRGERVTGTVVEHRPGGHGTWYPTVLFRTLDGQVIRTETRWASNGGPALGQQVQVVYDPLDPSRAELANRALLTPGIFLIFVLLGLVYICYTLFNSAGRS